MSSEVPPEARDPHPTGTTSPGQEGSGHLSHQRRAPSIGQSRCLDGHWECEGQERGRKRGAWVGPSKKLHLLQAMKMT